MRNTGKSWFQQQWAEACLNAGKTVLKVTKDGSFFLRRKKHLTLHENLGDELAGKTYTHVIIDELTEDEWLKDD